MHAELRVHDLVHRPHRAFAQEPDYAVCADCVVWIELSHILYILVDGS